MSDEIRPDSAIHKVRNYGASVLHKFGVPDVSEVHFNPKDPYVHECLWYRPFREDDPTIPPAYSRASLHAELIMLQAFGLIEIVEVFYLYDEYDIFRAFFRWTEAGAMELLKGLNGG